jgi:hypothetical protein
VAGLPLQADGPGKDRAVPSWNVDAFIEAVRQGVSLLVALGWHRARKAKISRGTSGLS